jgi:hypothetical protein
MHLIKALRSGVTIEQLNERYAIKSRRHGAHPQLVLFKYNQIDSPMGDPLVQEARGIILDEANNWEIVARPFDKFFNHEEGHALSIDWATARFYEKLDGSIITLYHYAGQWHVSTSGVPDANCEINDFGVTFAELFWKVFEAAGYKHPVDQTMNYMFELMTPYNQVVVRHDFNRLILIGARSLVTGMEVSVEVAGPSAGFEFVRSFPLGSLAQACASFATINPVEQEGYVVADGRFNRVKVKHPGYVALHHLKSGLSFRRLLEVVVAGETEEIVAHFPQYIEPIGLVKDKIRALTAEIAEDWRACNLPGLDRKGFAALATKTKHQDALFMLFSGKAADVAAYLKSLRVEVLYTCLGLDKEKI